MDSLIVITPAGFESNLTSRIPKRYRVSSGSAGAIVIEDGPRRILFWENAHVPAELDPKELENITRAIANPKFYSLDYHDIDFCRDLLVAIADDPRIIVNDNYGTTLAGSEFVRLLRANPAWDWRSKP